MRTILICAAAGALLLAGCGKGQPGFSDLYPVSGTITSGGQPVSGGVVRFTPDPDDPDFLINGEVGADGTFSLSTVRTTDKHGERKSGAPAGTYRITYSPNMADQTAGYKEPITLTKTVTIVPKANELKLELPKK